MHGDDRRDRAQLIQDFELTDIARVQNEVDVGPELSQAWRQLEQAIHDTFEVASEFTLGELEALVGFVLCRGARLRLARDHYSVEHDDEFTWVRRTQGEDRTASSAPADARPRAQAWPMPRWACLTWR